MAHNDEINNLLRAIPQVEKLIQESDISSFIKDIGRNQVTKAIRSGIEEFRDSIINREASAPELLKKRIIEKCLYKRSEKLQRVINCTGVIIHTNLGRAPLGSDILEKLKENISGYCNLEYHIPTKKRGKRGGFAEELVCELTGGEDALIVNNNASSVFLILNEFAKGKEAVVSRGELIQIGGGFRIPDIMDQSGAKLVEVGTTNITTLDDYKSAINENTSMVFSAHTSNYRIQGFTEAPSLKELSSLKSSSVIFIRDLGSGNFINDDRVDSRFEQTVFQELSQGPDLVCFSGDKLTGACQAGIITGRRDLIEALRKNPLMRMIRVDKVTYYILQETLLGYINEKGNNAELWNLILQDKEKVSAKVSKLLRMIDAGGKEKFLKKVPTTATYGGGTMPLSEVKSYGIELDIPGMEPEKIYEYFISSFPPIAGTVKNNRFVLDFYTVFEKDIKTLAVSINELLRARG